MYQGSSSQALFSRAKFLPFVPVLSSSSVPALPRFCRGYSNVNLSPGLHACIPTVHYQSPLLPSLLPYACIFHDHLTCPNKADLSLDAIILFCLFCWNPNLGSVNSFKWLSHSSQTMKLFWIYSTQDYWMPPEGRETKNPFIKHQTLLVLPYFGACV